MKSPLSLLILAACAASANAALLVGEPQVNAGDVLPAPIIAVAGDLLETSVASFSGENAGANPRNGSTGTAQANDATDPAVIWGQATTVYNLDLSAAPLGYDITAINVFSGWQDDRADQSYRIFYSLVGDAAFVQLGGDIVAGPVDNVPGSTLTRTYDTSGAAFLTGVDAIQFVQFDGPALYDGSETVYREFDLFGSPSATAFAITKISLVGDLLTLTWDTRPNTTYTLKYSKDLGDWNNDLDDGITSDLGNSTTKGFKLSDFGIDIDEFEALFFRFEAPR